MFTPVLLAKRPCGLKLQTSWKGYKDIYDIRKVLDLIKLEIEARKNVVVHEEK